MLSDIFLEIRARGHRNQSGSDEINSNTSIRHPFVQQNFPRAEIDTLSLGNRSLWSE